MENILLQDYIDDLEYRLEIVEKKEQNLCINTPKEIFSNEHCKMLNEKELLENILKDIEKYEASYEVDTTKDEALEEVARQNATGEL